MGGVQAKPRLADLLGFLEWRSLLSPIGRRAVRLRVFGDACADGSGQPGRPRGELKETASGPRAPGQGRGCRRHAGDCGAAHSGRTESRGGEARPEGGREARGCSFPVGPGSARPLRPAARRGSEQPSPRRSWSLLPRIRVILCIGTP